MNTLNLLKQLVSINSTFPNEEEISKFLVNYLEKLGFKVEIVKTEKNRPNIVATFGTAKKYIGFYGHMDTVPIDKNYIFNPLSIGVKDNLVYGLGVSDMKGGITAILKTAEFASQENLPIQIICGVEEEIFPKCS